MMEMTERFQQWLDALEQDLSQPAGSIERQEATNMLFQMWYAERYGQ